MSSQPHPHLYLDVDGTFQAEAPLFDDIETAVITDLHGAGYQTRYQITWAPAVVRGIESLREDFDLELIWLSTWLESPAPGMLDQLTAAVGGLAGGRRLIMPLRTRGGFISSSWKRDLLLADQENHPSPFIWADDVDTLPPLGSFVNSAFELPSLLISPDPSHGLSAEHLAEMRIFLEGL